MTVSNSTSFIQYAGNGVTVAFSFSSGGTPIPFFAKSDVVVSLFDTVANLAVTPAPVMGGGATYDYTVTASADPDTGEFISGATVTFNNAPLATYLVTLTRAVPQTQGVVLTDGKSFAAKVVEAALDRLTMIAQQIQTLVLRTLRQPTDDAAAIGAIPNKTTRSGKVLAFDAVTGDPIPSNLTLATLEAQPAAATASAAAAAASAAAASTSAGTAATSVTAAQAAQSAAESAAAGMKWRPSVRAATTANIVLSGTQAIDGIAVVAGDRVLVKDQAAPANNGIYVCAAGAWTRALDADTWAELVSQCVAVEVGTVSADFTYICTSDQGGTIGVTAVVWSTFKIVVPANGIADSQLAQMPQATVKGRASAAGTGDPGNLTGAQIAAMFTASTIQTFTAGSGTYTTPANCKRIRVRLVGAGGGSGGSGTGAGSGGGTGGNTTFSTLTGAGGVGGGVTANDGGSGGAATGGDVNIPGGKGRFGGTAGGGTVADGGDGSCSPLGAGGPAGFFNAAGNAGTGYGSGAGGAGHGGTYSGAAGGGSGGYVEKTITSPNATYAYGVGAAGTAGAAGTSGTAGAAGAGGIIIVEEFYA